MIIIIITSDTKSSNAWYQEISFSSWFSWFLSCGPLFILSCNPMIMLRGHSVLLLTGQFKVCVNWRAEFTGDRRESSDRLVPEGGGPEKQGNCLWIGCVWGKGRGLGKLYGRKRGWEIDCTAVHRQHAHTNKQTCTQRKIISMLRMESNFQCCSNDISNKQYFIVQRSAMTLLPLSIEGW